MERFKIYDFDEFNVEEKDNCILKVTQDICYQIAKEEDEKVKQLMVEYAKKNSITLKTINEETVKMIIDLGCKEYIKDYKSGYISTDKILKALGYEENDEEYKRIYGKEEAILSLIRTINEECDRLEDIEDQKTMLEIHNIEDQRDKYWQEKIRELLPKINGSINHFKSKNDNHIIKRIKRMLEDLTEEK